MTEYLRAGGSLEMAARIAGHESTRTTQLYNRLQDEVALDEIERIHIQESAFFRKEDSMDAEFLQLARQAVAGLQVANQPHWAEGAGVIVSGTVGLGQIGLIAWGLQRVGITSEERNRQLDIMEARQEAQGQALERQGRTLEELLRRST